MDIEQKGRLTCAWKGGGPCLADDCPRRRARLVKQWEWARFSINGYEVSSAGDKRFSALHARLKDGRTIEDAYQLDVNGYRKLYPKGTWRAGKGRAPMNGLSPEQLWEKYLVLWLTWANENPELIADLRQKAKGKVLTDKFASGAVSQARALVTIFNALDELPGSDLHSP